MASDSIAAVLTTRMLDESTYSPTQFLDYNFEEPSEEGYSDVVWMLMWALTLTAFLCCPFCGSAKRRELCMRRIRERRWIEDDLDEELEREAARRQLQRRQQLDDQQRRFQVSRTQEDEIREQFLNIVTEKYSRTLSSGDIFESDHKLVQSSSLQTIASQQTAATTVESDSHVDLKSSTHPGDLEAPNEEEEPSGSQSSDDEDEFMLVEDFQQTNEVVRVPRPGQENDSDSSPRFVPNGCAICLSKFEDGEAMTWSSNLDCSHVFHRECVVNWYLAVGRKAQQRLLRTNPGLDEMEVLNSICKFPMLCPCCRQTFCINPNDADDTTKTENPPQSLAANISDDTEVTEQESNAAEEIRVDGGEGQV